MSAQIFKSAKWATMLAIPILAIATWQEWVFAWGFLFVFWGILSMVVGQAFLVEPLTRQANPILFWLVTLAWLAFGVWYVVADLTHRL